MVAVHQQLALLTCQLSDPILGTPVATSLRNLASLPRNDSPLLSLATPLCEKASSLELGGVVASCFLYHSRYNTQHTYYKSSLHQYTCSPTTSCSTKWHRVDCQRSVPTSSHHGTVPVFDFVSDWEQPHVSSLLSY